MSKLLTVTWPRGKSRLSPAYENEGTSQERLIHVPFYDGDSPTKHNAFKDAVLQGDFWVQTQKMPGLRVANEVGQDRLLRLRSWDIEGSFTVS